MTSEGSPEVTDRTASGQCPCSGSTECDNDQCECEDPAVCKVGCAHFPLEFAQWEVPK